MTHRLAVRRRERNPTALRQRPLDLDSVPRLDDHDERSGRSLLACTQVTYLHRLKRRTAT
jgi:hypothetical protein